MLPGLVRVQVQVRAQLRVRVPGGRVGDPVECRRETRRRGSVRQVCAWGRRLLPVAALGLLLSGCAGYGGERSEASEGGLVVKSDGERCEITLPGGWTWLPAQWVARSDNGSTMTFQESLYGRPEYADWDESRDGMLATIRERSPEAQIDATDDRVLVDYGANGGMALLQRFDRVGCQIAFTARADAREADFADWQEILSTLGRISPTPGFTPVPD